MAEMSSKYTPAHKGEKRYSDKILKLAQRLSERIGHKITVNDPEYWGLACIIDDEIAGVALSMKVRKLYSFEQLVIINDIKDADRDKFQALLDRMAGIGILEYDYGDRYTKDGPEPDVSHGLKDRRYRLPLMAPGMAAYTNMDPDSLKAHPELAMFNERMSYLPVEKVAQLIPPGGAGIGMHVIPVEKAISMEKNTMDFEHISYWLKKYEGHLSASNCSCRLSSRMLDEGCADDYHDWCIGVGDMADYYIETGKGHAITFDEAMAILKRAEDNGFVHQVTNIDGEGRIFAICNCNANVCYALRNSLLFKTPNMSRSAYVARVEKDNCVACGRCAEYCPSGAVRLGRKLCKKDGTEAQYPETELPDDLKWGRERWDENYRDNNRINCYDVGTSPCKVACPAHIAVQGCLKKASQGKYRDALALIKKENPFPAVCGRICNRPCEDVCTRSNIDQAVAIDSVKKFIAEQDLNSDNRYVPEIVVASNVGRWKEKIAIIGGGPAGLSCAFFLAQMGYYPTVFEKNAKPGGLLAYGVPSYKLEKNVIDAEIEVLREMGVEIRCGIEVGRDVTIAQLREEGYKAFYIAIGCGMGKKPGIPGEDAIGCTTAIEFLRSANTGRATGNIEVSGRTVVIGGGNVAIDAARVNKRSGADTVMVLCLESRDIMPASSEEIAEAEEDGVDIRCGWGPKSIFTEDGKVTAVVFRRCLSVYDNDHRFNPVFDDNDTISIECDSIIFAVGQGIVWGELLKDTKVELGGDAYPAADPLTYQTAEPDIFVGGDVYTGPRFAIDAIAQGHEAAESLHRFVQNGHLTAGRNRRQYVALDKQDIRVLSYDTAARQTIPNDPAIDPKGFSDPRRTLTEEQVRIETSRCLGCGAAAVDENKCIGCGICTTKCEFDAIRLHRERPECGTMIKAEQKLEEILPYTAQRSIRIIRRKIADRRDRKKE